MNPFETAPEFVSLDNRQHRKNGPVTAEQLLNKHEVLLPAPTLAGKTVLDLGCALGATGRWALSHGAASYTGVEVQKTYADNARMLLEKYHPGKARIEQMPIESFLERESETYDILAMLGVLYVFVDYYSILKSIAARAKEAIALEGMYPDTARLPKDFVGVQFFGYHRINLADENASLTGRGSRISPAGLQFLMKDFGFESPGVVYPRPFKNSIDIYNVDTDPLNLRYLMRFERAGEAAASLSADLQGEKKGQRVVW